jgi:hypothetical protein
MDIVEILESLVRAAEHAPRFAFADDLVAAREALDSGEIGSARAALHVRALVDGARATPGFPFAREVDLADEALRASAPAAPGKRDLLAPASP